MQNSDNSNFKLVAIIPLKNCADEFRKNLDVGKIYQFYQKYTIELNSDFSLVLSAICDDSDPVPKNLYKLKNGINVSFSAVVGKNGTGKSALFELLYRFIYFISTRKIVNKEQILRTRLEEMQDELKYQKKDLSILIKKANLDNKEYFNLEGYESEDSSTDNVDVFVFKLLQKYRFTFNVEMVADLQGVYRKVAAELRSMIADTQWGIVKERENENLFDIRLNVSVIYEINESIFEVNLFEGKFTFNQFDITTGEKEPIFTSSFDLENFFYSISLNYSHHSLNSKSIGNWINKLFFKNDGYRTPLVLNPMRDNGNFNINDEIDLSNERLMSTLLYDYILKESNSLLNKYKVTKFIFTRKPTPYHSIYTKKDFDELPNSSLIRSIYGIDENYSGIPNAEAAINYLSKKISKIDNNYDYLVNGYKSFEDFLKRDGSHITKKMRQTVNYLKNGNQDYWSHDDENNPFEVSLTPNLLKDYFDSFNVDISSTEPSALIEYALPGFFKIDFEFSYQEDRTIKLSDMSSGEQQMIFNSNAILYHLYNIQSVFISNKGNAVRRSNERPAYSCVNLILDEMELYYHPEMQRRFVSDLMNVFSKINKGGIQSINVCILTHSPFVLSDIPMQNILQLKENLDRIVDPINPIHQSFASNIHDLLKREFVLENGFIGEFARQKIINLIDSLQIHEQAHILNLAINNKLTKTKKKAVLKNIPDLKEFYFSELMSEEDCRACISIVGEPVLYESLIELFIRAFPKEEESFIEQQLNILNKLKKR